MRCNHHIIVSRPFVRARAVWTIPQDLHPGLVVSVLRRMPFLTQPLPPIVIGYWVVLALAFGASTLSQCSEFLGFYILLVWPILFYYYPAIIQHHGLHG